MADKGAVLITGIDHEDGDKIYVDFSDGTTGMYTVEELLELRPDRDANLEPSEVAEPLPSD